MNKLFIIPIITTLLLSACTNKKQENTEETETTMDNMETENQGNRPLDSLLNVRKAAFEASATDAKKTLYSDGLEAIKNTGILSTALNVGGKAPDFMLKNSLNEDITLYEQLKKGPVILTWYRGGWCPYCNITLQYLQQRLPDFQKEGAELIALTPELPDKSLTTAEKHDLQFDVLSDIGNKVAEKYGVVYTLTDQVAKSYQESFDLHGYNGDESNALPLAATYLIDTDGIIQYAFLDVDYRNRAEPDDIISSLKSLKDKSGE